MKQQEEWEAAVVMAVVCWERIGGDSGEDGCMHKCEDKNLEGHIVTIVIAYNCEGCYCHSLSYQEQLLS